MWVKTPEELGLKPEDHFYPWLTMPYVLSAALRQLCQQLTVSVISQQLETALPEEQQLLKIQENNSLIRQVYLCGDGEPWVQARVVVPFATYQNHKQDFDDLGDKLLGETLLYNKPGIMRSMFEYSRHSNSIYTRRSVFTINLQLLMIMETFLSNIPEFCR